MKYIIGVGTNLGSKFINIEQAIKYLRLNNELKIIKISNIYQSDALLPSNCPLDWNKEYFNLSILIEFNNSPQKLLSLLQSIEIKMGRKQNRPKWSPRVIDLDILIAENLTHYDEILKIPHPEFFKREFTLIPSAEIAPNIILLKKQEFLKKSNLQLVSQDNYLTKYLT